MWSEDISYQTKQNVCCFMNSRLSFNPIFEADDKERERPTKRERPPKQEEFVSYF
jgi:hypothetical protein